MDCWNCGTTLKLSIPRKVLRSEFCTQCENDSHVCKNCRFYDLSYYNDCIETQAEWVKDKEKANYCDYFEPSTRIETRAEIKSSLEKTKTAFDQLFKD